MYLIKCVKIINHQEEEEEKKAKTNINLKKMRNTDTLSMNRDS